MIGSDKSDVDIIGY